MKVEEWLKTKTNFIFIGESGCGKTELSVNFAKKITAFTDKKINLLDMDQTKQLFRSRDLAFLFKDERVKLLSGVQFLDMPTVLPGVIARLTEKETINILDVGGNEIGAIEIGQFASFINSKETMVFYIVNPYRNFSSSIENIQKLLKSITAAGRIQEVHLISNPNVGKATTFEIIKEGQERLTQMLSSVGLFAEAMVVPDFVDVERCRETFNIEVYEITPYIVYP